MFVQVYVPSGGIKGQTLGVAVTIRPDVGVALLTICKWVVRWNAAVRVKAQGLAQLAELVLGSLPVVKTIPRGHQQRLIRQLYEAAAKVGIGIVSGRGGKNGRHVIQAIYAQGSADYARGIGVCCARGK